MSHSFEKLYLIRTPQPVLKFNATDNFPQNRHSCSLRTYLWKRSRLAPSTAHIYREAFPRSPGLTLLNSTCNLRTSALVFYKCYSPGNSPMALFLSLPVWLSLCHAVSGSCRAGLEALTGGAVGHVGRGWGHLRVVQWGPIQPAGQTHAPERC